MTRGILLAGNESALFQAAAAEAAKRVDEYAAAFIPNPFPRGGAPSGETEKGSESSSGCCRLQWNPGSPISAHTFTLAAENRLGQIDDAVLICSPPAIYKAPESLVPVEMDRLINDQIKGWFFLIRELAIIFRGRGKGNLALVVPDLLPGGGGESQADLFGVSAAAAFRSLTEGLLSSAKNEPFQILGFSCSESGIEEKFAAWIFRFIDEGSRKDSGRMRRYSKRGLF